MKVKVLFTGSGRRVSLLRFFKLSGKRIGVDVEVHAADSGSTAPTWVEADQRHHVPGTDSHHYIDSLAAICDECAIDILVPLIDPDLIAISAGRENIEACGTKVVLSSAETVTICADKVLTAAHLRNAGVDVPETWSMEAGEKPPKDAYPVIIKPRKGSGSIGVATASNPDELKYLAAHTQAPCAQEFLQGREYTFDVFASEKGEVLCVVPRWRIATRAGESSKGLTDLSPRLIEAAQNCVSSLPGAFGPITIQAFLCQDDRILFTEVNLRFGGGYVLSYHAGADFPGAILLNRLGRELPGELFSVKDGAVLLRYDDELITDIETLRGWGFDG